VKIAKTILMSHISEMILIKILFKVILSLLFILTYLFCYLILAVGWDYSTHTIILEYVEYHPSEELINFIVAIIIYIFLIVLFLSFRIRSSRFSISWFVVFLIHFLIVLSELFSLIFVQDVGIDEVRIIIYISFFVKLVIMIGTLAGFIWIYKRKERSSRQPQGNDKTLSETPDK
jgi:hypothetical protein